MVRLPAINVFTGTAAGRPIVLEWYRVAKTASNAAEIKDVAFFFDVSWELACFPRRISARDVGTAGALSRRTQEECLSRRFAGRPSECV